MTKSGADLQRAQLLSSLGLSSGTPLDGARLTQLLQEHSQALMDSTPDPVGPLSAGSRMSLKRVA